MHKGLITLLIAILIAQNAMAQNLKIKPNALGNNANSATQNKIKPYCNQAGPKITKIYPAISQSWFSTIYTECAGEKMGKAFAVRLHYDGDKPDLIDMPLEISAWKNDHIIVRLPENEIGLAGKSIVVKIVRADDLRPTNFNANFEPKREVVEVTNKISHQTALVGTRQYSNLYVQHNDTNNGVDMLENWEKIPNQANYPQGQVINPNEDLPIAKTKYGNSQINDDYSIDINPDCRLDTIYWKSDHGKIVAFDGFDNRTNSHAKIHVKMNALSFTRGESRTYRAKYTITSFASCPIGIKP